MNRTLLRTTALIVCLAGAGTTGVLTAEFGDVQTGAESILTAFCARGDSTSTLCSEVVDSRWGSVDVYLGQRRVLVPTSLVGLSYFLAIAIALIVMTPQDLSSRWIRRGIRLMTAGSVLVSFALMGVMALSLERWCAACLLTHGLNLILAILLLRLTRTETAACSEVEHRGESSFARGRRVAATGCLASLAAMGLLALFDANVAADRAISKAGGLATIIEGYQSDPNRMLREFYATPVRDVASPYSPGDEDAPLHLLIYDDISSRASACFERDWADAYLPVIERPVHIDLRPFPARFARAWRDACALEAECDVPHDRLPLRAMSLLIAHDMGGERAGIAMRGRLLRDKRVNDAAGLSELARRAGIEPDEFRLRLERRDGLERIRSDVREALSLGIEEAPAVFLNGRLVPPMCLKSEAFWRAIGAPHDPRNFIPIGKVEIETVARGDD